MPERQATRQLHPARRAYVALAGHERTVLVAPDSAFIGKDQSSV
jgi:hypothetical protein